MAKIINAEIKLRTKGLKARIRYYKQTIKKPPTSWIAANIYLFEGWLRSAENDLLVCMKRE